MPHSRFVDTNGILITTLSGVITLKELIELEDGLCSYVRDGEIYELVLHSDDVRVVMDMNNSVTSAENFKSVMKGLKNGAIAFVSDRNFIYGLCRQLEILSENEFIQVCVFRTEETARKWLCEMQSWNKADAGDGFGPSVTRGSEEQSIRK